MRFWGVFFFCPPPTYSNKVIKIQNSHYTQKTRHSVLLWAPTKFCLWYQELKREEKKHAITSWHLIVNVNSEAGESPLEEKTEGWAHHGWGTKWDKIKLSGNRNISCFLARALWWDCVNNALRFYFKPLLPAHYRLDFQLAMGDSLPTCKYLIWYEPPVYMVVWSESNLKATCDYYKSERHCFILILNPVVLYVNLGLPGD